MAARGWRNAPCLLAMIGTLLAATFATAPAVRAECDGGFLFGETVPHARAAIVGRITGLAAGRYGLLDVTSVRVERAYGVDPGAVYRVRATTGWCADYPKIGLRVVLLLDVDLPGTRLDGDYFYVVGQSVTSAEAAGIGATLPDTATNAVAPSGPITLLSPCPVAAAGGLGFLLAWRRLSRAGARPRTPRPRTRAA